MIEKARTRGGEFRIRNSVSQLHCAQHKSVDLPRSSEVREYISGGAEQLAPALKVSSYQPLMLYISRVEPHTKQQQANKVLTVVFIEGLHPKQVSYPGSPQRPIQSISSHIVESQGTMPDKFARRNRQYSTL